MVLAAVPLHNMRGALPLQAVRAMPVALAPGLVTATLAVAVVVPVPLDRLFNPFSFLVSAVRVLLHQ